MKTPHTDHLAATGKAARSLGLRVTEVTVETIDGVVAENQRLLTLLEGRATEILRLSDELEDRDAQRVNAVNALGARTDGARR